MWCEDMAGTYICFCHSSVPFFKRLLKKGFGHCFLAKRFANGWFLFDPKPPAMEGEMLPGDNSLNTLRNEVGYSTAIVYVETDNKLVKGSAIRFNPINSCVTIVKYISGLRLNSLTSYQLYKQLASMSESEQYKGSIVKVKMIQRGYNNGRS